MKVYFKIPRILLIVVLWVSPFVASFVVVGCVHVRSVDYLQFQESATSPSENTSKEVTALTKIQNSMNRREFTNAYAAARNFQLDYPVSQYLLWARMMEAKSLEGMESYQDAIKIYSAIIQLTAGKEDMTLMQIQTAALYNRARCFSRLGDEEKALPSLVDAYNKREHLPLLMGEVELPLEMARNYSLMKLSKEASDYEKISAANLKNYLLKTPLEMSKRAEIYLKLGWKENLPQHSLQDLNFIQSDHQKNLYLLGALQTEISPYAQLALDNLVGTMNHYLKPLRARADFEQKKIYALELAEAYRELDLRLSPENMRGDYEKQLAEFLKAYQEELFGVFQKQNLITGLTQESKDLNSIRRDYFFRPLRSGGKPQLFMPPVQVKPESSPPPESLPPQPTESIPTIDPNL